eukprot:43875-Eustigmatos_ZCMA.PRE.1
MEGRHMGPQGSGASPRTYIISIEASGTTGVTMVSAPHRCCDGNIVIRQRPLESWCAEAAAWTCASLSLSHILLVTNL